VKSLLKSTSFLFGDSYMRDDVGRRVEVKYVGRLRGVYWVDHASKEVKVLKLEPL